MDSKLALKVNKFIHEQCIDGTPHDIGWNVIKLIEAETQVKLFCQPAVISSVCNSPCCKGIAKHEVKVPNEFYCDECFKQTDL